MLLEFVDQPLERCGIAAESAVDAFPGDQDRPSDFGGRSEDSFTVVAPSLPGYGFSFTAGQRRFGLRDATDILAVLMTDVLGYDKFSLTARILAPMSPPISATPTPARRWASTSR